MYELFAFPDTYALGAHWLLQESGVNYRVINVRPIDAQLDAATASAFVSASPHRRVPALRLPNGHSLCESSAIALYLADTLADGKFTVAADNPQRPAYLQWLFYLSSTLQPDVMLQFHPEYYFDNSTDRQQLKHAAMNRLAAIWPILDKLYEGKTWLFDDRPSAIDFSLAPVLQWSEPFPESLEKYPSIHRLQQAISARPGYQEVLAWHQRQTTQTGNPACECR